MEITNHNLNVVLGEDGISVAVEQTIDVQTPTMEIIASSDLGVIND